MARPIGVAEFGDLLAIFRASFERTQGLIVSGRNELWTIEAEG